MSSRREKTSGRKRKSGFTSAVAEAALPAVVDDSPSVKGEFALKANGALAPPDAAAALSVATGTEVEAAARDVCDLKAAPGAATEAAVLLAAPARFEDESEAQASMRARSCGATDGETLASAKSKSAAVTAVACRSRSAAAKPKTTAQQHATTASTEAAQNHQLVRTRRASQRR